MFRRKGSNVVKELIRRDVTGNKMFGSASAAVVAEEHPNGADDNAYLELTSSGLINHGTDVPAYYFAPVGEFAVPYTAIPFPIKTCVKYEPYNVPGANMGTDLDYDGTSETGTVQATSMLSLEDVTVPVGTFKRALRFETVETTTLSYTSGKGSTGSSQKHLIEWYATGVGLVKRYLKGINEEDTYDLIAYSVGDDRHGVVPVGWLAHDVKPLDSIPDGVDHPAVASDGKQFLVVVPSNNRDGESAGSLLIAVVDQDGKPVSSAPLFTNRDVLFSPSLAWNGRRYLLAYSNYFTECVEMVTLSASGEKLSGPTVLKSGAGAPYVLGTDDGFLVAFSAGSGDSSEAPGGMWVSTVDDSGTPISQVRAYPDSAQAAPVLAKDSAGGLMALFRVPQTGPAASLHFGDSLAFARLTPDGHGVDAGPIFLHESLDLDHRDYNLVFDGQNFLAGWSQRGSTDLEVRVARVSREGEVLGETGGSTIVGAGASPRLMGLGSHPLMIWGQRLKDDWWSAGIGGIRLSQDGRPLDPTSKGGNDTWLSADFGAGYESLYAAATSGDRALIVWTGSEGTRYSPSDIRGLACAVAYPW